MIIKKRTTDFTYMGLQMLYKRLPNRHAMKNVIYSKMLSAKAGIIGETTVENIFDKYNFPFNYCVLHDVCLTSNAKFQIDTLFLTQYYAVILECKNIVGELCFENEPSCLKRRSENGKQDMFESPEMQVDRNIYLLREWLNKAGIEIPIVGIIVLSSLKSIVVKPPNHTSVIYATNIPVYLRKLQRQIKYLSIAQMNDISEKIIEHHQTYIPFPMCKNWRIDPTDLITGVYCKRCEGFEMEKLKIGWHCLSCRNIDRLAHEDAIRDWFGLISNDLTNKECREFLHLSSNQASLRIIKTMNLTKIGENNKTSYQWDWT